MISLLDIERLPVPVPGELIDGVLAEHQLGNIEWGGKHHGWCYHCAAPWPCPYQNLLGHLMWLLDERKWQLDNSTVTLRNPAKPT